jgi:hypothetical protein
MVCYDYRTVGNGCAANRMFRGNLNPVDFQLRDIGIDISVPSRAGDSRVSSMRLRKESFYRRTILSDRNFFRAFLVSTISFAASTIPS